MPIVIVIEIAEPDQRRRLCYCFTFKTNCKWIKF